MASLVPSHGNCTSFQIDDVTGWLFLSTFLPLLKGVTAMNGRVSPCTCENLLFRSLSASAMCNIAYGDWPITTKGWSRRLSWWWIRLFAHDLDSSCSWLWSSSYRRIFMQNYRTEFGFIHEIYQDGFCERVAKDTASHPSWCTHAAVQPNWRTRKRLLSYRKPKVVAQATLYGNCWFHLLIKNKVLEQRRTRK